MDDPVLSAQFLKMCAFSYIKGNREDHEPIGDPEVDYFICPGLTPDSLLSEYPPTKLQMSGNDPLRDDQYKFMLRLLKLGRQVHIKEYKYFPHGFLNFDLPMVGITDSKECVNTAVDWFLEEKTK
jgi:acetyl esterase/lipase